MSEPHKGLTINLNQWEYAGEWVEFRPGVELLLRPFPRSIDNLVLKGGGVELPGGDLLREFTYCLVDWRGVEIVINGEKAGCTEAVKKHIFDFDIEGMAGFVIAKVREKARSREAVSKN